MSGGGYVEELTGLISVAQAAVETALRRAGPALLTGDLGALERVVQAALRPVGAAVVEATVAVRCAREGHQSRPCAGCGRRVRRVARARARHLAGLVGDYV